MTSQPEQTGQQPQAPDNLDALLVVQAATLLTLKEGSAYAATISLRRALAAFARDANRRWITVAGQSNQALRERDREQLSQALRLELRQVAAATGRDLGPILRQEAARALELGAQHAGQQISLAVDVAELALDDEAHRIIEATPQAAISHLLKAAEKIERAQSTLDVQMAVAEAQRSVTSVNTGSTYLTNHVANDAARQVAVRFGEKLLWIAERDACVVCLKLSGELADPNEGLGFDEFATFGPYEPPSVWPYGMPLMRPPRHPHCLPGDALVTPSGRITGATARVYDGELVEIRTLSQKVFTATPNHPVLTDRGWVPVGLLHQGGYVVSAAGSERVVLGDDDDQHVPARIQDVAKAFLGSRYVAAVEVPLAAEDFHGDGRGSKIAVVGSDRLLGNGLHAAVCQKHSEMTFEFADVPRRQLVFPRSRDLLLQRDGLATSGLMSSHGQARTLVAAGRGHAGVHAVATAARLYSGFEQDAADSRPADAVGFAQGLFARSGAVELDQIVEIRRYPFRGHVYNLETSDGWYIGNGIVTHNCRCQVSVWLGSAPGQPDFPERLKHEAARSVLKGWSLPSESNRVRLRAAESLLAGGGRGLPRSVQEEAALAIARGRFKSRSVPHYTPREKHHV